MPSPSRRHWYQFSLKGLFVAVTLLALGTFVTSWTVQTNDLAAIVERVRTLMKLGSVACLFVAAGVWLRRKHREGMDLGVAILWSLLILGLLCLILAALFPSVQHVHE